MTQPKTRKRNSCYRKRQLNRVFAQNNQSNPFMNLSAESREAHCLHTNRGDRKLVYINRFKLQFTLCLISQ